MMGDIEVMGEAGLELLRAWAGEEARFRVPITTNARCVDFAAAERLLQDPAMVRKERELIGCLRAIGIKQTDTCINYQTVYQPHFGEHVAWGDTGTVIYANSVLGARSNFESGPAAFAAGLTGRTPRYGFHETACRRGTVLVEVTAKLEDLADWGALGAAVGRACDDYWHVPVLDGIRTVPNPDQLKHLGASLASYGSLAMFHMTGVTPEARTLDEAFRGKPPERVVLVDQAALDAVFASYPADRLEVDLVVLTGPQLSVFELRLVSDLLDRRRVHANTQLIVTTNRQNFAAARELGLDVTGGQMSEERRAGLIGLGTMGAPMARQILSKHGALIAYDTDARALGSLARDGAHAAGSPREVGEQSDAVITMLPHPDVLKEVVLGAEGLIYGLKPGATDIDMSTSGLEAVHAIGRALAEKGIRMVDAPVGKGPWAAEKGELTVLMAGDERECRAVEWLLSMVGSTLYYCGPLGAGQLIELANNLVACGNMAMLAEAYKMAAEGGARLDVLCEMMPNTSADSWQLRHTLNGKLRKGDLSPMFKLKLAHKDMRLIVEMAERLGTPIACGRAVLDWYEKGFEAGYGELDWGAIMLTANPELGAD
jgi:hypothetical protein